MDIKISRIQAATQTVFLVLTALASIHSVPTAARPLTTSLCQPDNGTDIDDTVFTRAAARAHTDTFGVSVPSAWFRGMVRAAAVTIQYRDERRKWVMLTMADVKVAQKVLPIALRALDRLPVEQGLADIDASLLPPAASRQLDDRGANATALVTAGRRLSSLMVVITWDSEAQAECMKLKEGGSKHNCVQDALHELHHPNTTSSLLSAFHSPEFNALGFAKVKYLYNALSLGYDVIMMDADVLVLQSPFPFVLQQGAHLAALTERCEVVDPNMQLQLGAARHPNQNIGVLSARSEGPVLRCIERWFGSLVVHVDSPRLWDQEEFNRVIAICAPALGLRWHSFDNRRFVSLCYPLCGCSYADEEQALLTDPAMRRKHFEWSFRRGHSYDDPKSHTCGPSAWADWILAHFPCQGSMKDKALNMGRLLEGYLAGEPRVIKNKDKVP